MSTTVEFFLIQKYNNTHKLLIASIYLKSKDYGNVKLYELVCNMV